MIAGEIRLVRLVAERAALIRMNRGYGFAVQRPLFETYLRDDDARQRFGRDPLRPEDSHLAAFTEVEAEISALDSTLDSAPVSALSAQLGLSPLERALLRSAVAHALDADVRAICAALSGLPRPVLTAALCQELWPRLLSDHGALFAALHSRGALARTRAIVGEGVGLAREIAVGPDLVSAVFGDGRIPDRLARAIEHPSPDELRLLSAPERARVAELAALCAKGDPPAVIVKGPQGSGKRSLALELAAALGRRLVAIDATQVGSGAELIDALAFARLSDRLPYIAGVETIEDRSIVRAIDDHDDAVVLGSREGGISSTRLSRPIHIIQCARPTLDVRREAWRAGLNATGTIDPSEADSLAARYVIGSGAISEVLLDARRYAVATAEPLATSHLEDAISRRLSLNLGVLGQRITRRASFGEMVLPDDVTETLRDLIAMVEGRSQILESWGYEKHLGLSRGVSALFSGGPGTGKTMAASVISSELGLELFRIDLSSVVSKWVGETEKNLAKIFDEAQDAHAMLLFDEADSLFGKRTDVQNASDRYANLEVNYVLQRMEQFDGISILTTNLESGIDPAFMRRLNFRVRFPDPEEEERADLWRKLLPPESGLGEVDVTDLAERFEMSGGHIRNAIVRAAVVASREGRSMEKDDLLRGAHHEYYELGKVMHSSL